MGTIFLIAVSVSLDTLGIGMAYSMSGIRIPWRTRLVVGAVNGIITALSLLLCEPLRVLIPSAAFRIGGASIIMGMGIRTLWNALGDNKTADYDKDASRVLEIWEGVLLGLALAADAFCAGLFVAEYGCAAWLFPVFTALAGIGGLAVGSKWRYNLRRVNGIGGALLIVLGVLRLFL